MHSLHFRSQRMSFVIPLLFSLQGSEYKIIKIIILTGITSLSSVVVVIYRMRINLFPRNLFFGA